MLLQKRLEMRERLYASIDALARLVADLDAALNRREQDLARRQEDLARWQADLARREQDLAAREADLQRREEDLTRRAEDLDRWAADLHQLAGRLAERERILDRLEASGQRQREAAAVRIRGGEDRRVARLPAEDEGDEEVRPGPVRVSGVAVLQPPSAAAEAPAPAAQAAPPAAEAPPPPQPAPPPPRQAVVETLPVRIVGPGGEFQTAQARVIWGEGE